MADESDEEKNLDPSEKRKQEYREQGKVAKSQEINGTVGLLVGFGAIIVFSPQMAEESVSLARWSWQWTSQVTAMEEPGVPHTIRSVMNSLSIILGPPMLAMFLGSLAVGAAQSRLIIPKEPLKLDWNKINPVTNAQQKFFSSSPFVEAAKGIVKIFAIGAAVWWGVKPHLGLLPALTYADPAEALEQMSSFALLVLLRALPIAIIIAIADYSYQAWKLYEQMKMSRQDLKDEQKQSEGDPQLKSARRQRQIEISRRAAALKAVPDADVIITNPTHYAIALRYRKDEAPAPIVLARGLDELALKMQQVARRHDVPRIENRPLARALYAQCREGQMIHEDLYEAVAQVLAIIYRRRAARRDR
ncbi:MAG: EscU/YscU/HrcU family type III secretion system export apparatus switch protein [Myxococcota bacterium]